MSVRTLFLYLLRLFIHTLLTAYDPRCKTIKLSKYFAKIILHSTAALYQLVNIYQNVFSVEKHRIHFLSEYDDSMLEKNSVLF